MKIITMCGSLKFESDIRYWSEKLALEGNCVLSIIYPTTAEGKDVYTPEQRDLRAMAHKKRIELADAIFVVNKNGYIGSSTCDEIEYAKALGKEILFSSTVGEVPFYPRTSDIVTPADLAKSSAGMTMPEVEVWR